MRKPIEKCAPLGIIGIMVMVRIRITVMRGVRGVMAKIGIMRGTRTRCHGRSPSKKAHKKIV